MDNFFDDADLIYCYSRAQAIADGFLIDVSATAREAGIRFPVALTRAVWCRCIELPPGVECQDEAGRLWDVLSMLRVAIGATSGGSTLLYRLYVRNDNRRPKRVTLKALCGPGDDAAPVLTVMLPDEGASCHDAD
jgi:hypothetical protein